jgi:hypothetical protein
MPGCGFGWARLAWYTSGMMRAAVLVLICALLPISVARAIEDETSRVTYNGTAPTNANIPNWSNGWVQPAVQPSGSTSTTGWNYCGSVGGNSAVYLGDGWVLTAAHVGAGDLDLNNVTYPMVANTAQVLNSVQVTGQAAPTSTQADLVLFKVSPAPSLPPIAFRQSDPVAGTSQVAMLGYGHTNGDRVVTWGFNTVTPRANPVNIQTVNYGLSLTSGSSNYYSNDFLTLTQDGTPTNNYQVVIGDSGGPDFIYNSTTKVWELAGLNEAELSNDGNPPDLSAMIQLDTYLPQITAILAPQADTPAMPASAVGVLAISLATMAAVPLARREHSPGSSSKG